MDNPGLTNSFGLGSFMQRDMIILHQWKLVPCPGKSMGESSSGDKVIQHVINEENLDLETSPASKMSSGEQNRVLTHSIERPTWLEELASESNTIQAHRTITAPGRLELQTR